MMGLRSTADTGSPDTSLVTPSDKDLSSGQQRVLNQVNTIKRSKSKYKNGTTSPTSPAPQTLKTSDFGMFKYRAASTYSRTNSSGSAAFHNKKSRSLTTKSMKGRLVNSNLEQVNTSSWTKSPNGLKPSRSDPVLTSASCLAPARSMKAKGQINSSQIQVTKESRSIINGPTFTESQTHIFRSPSTQSQTDGKLGTIRVSKIEQSPMVNSTGYMQDNITLKEAVDYLSSSNESYQQQGANYIQHVSYSEDSAKAEVFKLNGIPPLVNMLDSSNSSLQKAASGALRNLVFKNMDNKIEVQKSGGIAKVLNQMKNTKSTETQRQLAGLLWNLSSAEVLKNELISTALIALTKNVVVPYSIPKDDPECVDPEVFYFATGCLRNLSSGSAQDREKMRACENLIEALVTYISSCEKEGKSDEKPVENCMCTLHNLTYQLWQECPEASFSTEAQSEGRKSPTVGCFSPRSRKAKDEIFSNPPQVLANDSNKIALASKVEWLYNSKATDLYVSLLKSSENNAIKEASCGAMQNLTASKEKGSVVVSEHLFKQLADNFLLSSLLRSKATQKTYASLLDNMSRKPTLLSQMAPKILPELGKVLSDNAWQGEAHPDTVATVCNVLHRLLLVDRDISKKTMSAKVIIGLLEISERDPEDSGSLAASKLLHNLWTDKFLRSTIKHLKFDKFKFVNPKTIAAATKSTPDE
ncbi:plakophilin-1 [Xiphophorus couchianus]|uniref:plakophilin-1 n=1 Tax=Xiphophorus couchianus TaxID=32473 RepID=UPI001016407B|nr:plakophilin-1-like [Xiphophorus couchianus]XP_027882994.1 plakophilin-1-like [Xiphophorus couchianus]